MVIHEEPCVTSVEVISTRTTDTSLLILAPASYWCYIRCDLVVTKMMQHYLDDGDAQIIAVAD